MSKKSCTIFIVFLLYENGQELYNILNLATSPVKGSSTTGVRSPLFLYTINYWVPQKLPQICTVIAYTSVLGRLCDLYWVYWTI